MTNAPSIRPALRADDQWYPSHANELRALIRELIERAAIPLLEGELVGLIVPHAGYQFSGSTAAHAYKLLHPREFERVVLIGPSHFADLGAVAASDKDFFATPLGNVPLDREFLERLNTSLALNWFTRDQEHSLEVQLPFLQTTLGDFKLVPLLMSYPFYIVGLRARNWCDELSTALVPLIKNSRTLLVASSDLSHLHDYDSVTYFDRRLEMFVEEFDIGGLVDFMANEEQEARACGDAPIITTMLTAKALGANKIVVLHRTNSGDVTGIKISGQYTVGYMAAALVKTN